MSSLPDRPHLVISPGRGNSGPEHWQAYVEQHWGDTSRVQQSLWNWPTRYQWVAGIERHVRPIERPMILVGHSAGALAIAEWALRGGSTQNVVAALLVAPPDMEGASRALPALWFRRLIGWAPISRQPLPFPSILVTSTNDHYGEEPDLQKIGAGWGSKMISLGESGHINHKSGYGPWQQVLEWIEDLSQVG